MCVYACMPLIQALRLRVDIVLPAAPFRVSSEKSGVLFELKD